MTPVFYYPRNAVEIVLSGRFIVGTFSVGNKVGRTRIVFPTTFIKFTDESLNGKFFLTKRSLGEPRVVYDQDQH